jgi:hypothetical protein
MTYVSVWLYVCYNYSNLESVIIICGYASEYPINRFTNPNPVYLSLIHVTVFMISHE